MKKTDRALLILISAMMIVVPMLSLKSYGAIFAKQEFIVLIDEYHGSTYRVADFIPLFSEINGTLGDSYVKLYGVRQRISSEALISADLLIIPPTNGSVGFSDAEKLAIKNYVQAGGSVAILGVPFTVGRFNPTAVNVLVEAFFSNIRFFSKGAYSDSVIQNINSTNGLFSVDDGCAEGDEVKALIKEPLMLKSASLEGEEEGVEEIHSPPTTIRIDKEGAIYYNTSGFLIFAMKKYGSGSIALLGFGQILTNATFNETTRWSELGGNGEFALNLVRKLMKLERWRAREPIRVTWLPIALIATAVVGFAVSPLAFKRDIKRIARLEKKKKEVKISELLKKVG